MHIRSKPVYSNKIYLYYNVMAGEIVSDFTIQLRITNDSCDKFFFEDLNLILFHITQFSLISI